LGASVETAAQRILRQAAHVVATEVRRALAARGLEAGKTWLFATGGAGGLLAAAIATEAGLAGFLAFPLSPVFSAFGLSRLDLLHAYEARPDGPAEATLERLTARALQDMRGEGVDTTSVRITVEGERARSDGSVEAVDLGDARAALKAAKEKGSALRLLRLKAVVPGRRPGLERRAAGKNAQARVSRAVVWKTEPEATPVYAWDELAAGAKLDGPAIVESGDTTVPVPPGMAVIVGALGELRVQLSPSPELRSTSPQRGEVGGRT
ncbi:MAG: hydantoinase/oxoprolinase family protein, partial [Candidatus Binatia bacterium]